VTRRACSPGPCGLSPAAFRDQVEPAPSMRSPTAGACLSDPAKRHAPEHAPRQPRPVRAPSSVRQQSPRPPLPARNAPPKHREPQLRQCSPRSRASAPRTRRTNGHSPRKRRSDALCGRLQNRDALHVVRHRKQVTLSHSHKPQVRGAFSAHRHGGGHSERQMSVMPGSPPASCSEGMAVTTNSAGRALQRSRSSRLAGAGIGTTWHTVSTATGFGRPVAPTDG
jgi:hypothetical protein